MSFLQLEVRPLRVDDSVFRLSTGSFTSATGGLPPSKRALAMIVDDVVCTSTQAASANARANRSEGAPPAHITPVALPRVARPRRGLLSCLLPVHTGESAPTGPGSVAGTAPVTIYLSPSREDGGKGRRQRTAVKAALCCSAAIIAACAVILLAVLEFGRVTRTRARPEIVRVTGFQHDASSVELYASGALAYPAAFSSIQTESASCFLGGAELPVMSVALNSTARNRHFSPGQPSFEVRSRLTIHDFEELHSLVAAPPASTNASCDTHGTVMLFGMWPVAVAARASFMIIDPAQSNIPQVGGSQLQTRRAPLRHVTRTA